MASLTVTAGVPTGEAELNGATSSTQVTIADSDAQVQGRSVDVRRVRRVERTIGSDLGAGDGTWHWPLPAAPYEDVERGRCPPLGT